MDNPKVKSKTYSKIVPLKGSLKQILKNQFRKDKAKTNDAATGATSAVATVSNDKQHATVPPTENSLKSSENKIIIQKVENVRIETISTTPQGPVRRVSSFFNLGKSSQAENSYKTTTQPASKEDDEMSEGIFKVPNAELNGAQETNAPIKLFSTKMPENSRNQKIPLKLTRIIKLPFKPKPIMRPRVHRVETFKSIIVPVNNATDTPSEVPFSISIPDIEMSDIQEQTDAPGFNSSQNLRKSPLEENFKGFVSDRIEKNNMWMKLFGTTHNEGNESVSEIPMQTVNNGEPSTSASVKQPTASQVLKSVKPSSPKKPPKAGQNLTMNFVVNVKDVKTEIPSRVPKAPRPRSPQVKHPRIKALKLDASPPAQLISVNRAVRSPPQVPVKQLECPQVTSPSPEHTPFRFEIVKGVGDTRVLLKPITANVEAIAAEAPSTSKSIEARPTPSTSKPFEGIAAPSTSKGTSANKKKKSSSWKEDILVVIGKPRLAEIDKDLKKIPDLVTGSSIDSENVEFKLIIKHLLRLLKVNSVIEALRFTLPDEDPFDDDNDDFPDSFDDDSHGPGNYSTGNSMDSSSFGDDNDQFNCDNVGTPDPSHFDSPAAARKMTDSTANETLALNSMDSSSFGDDDNDQFNCDNVGTPDPSHIDSPAAARGMTDSTANETLAPNVPDNDVPEQPRKRRGRPPKKPSASPYAKKPVKNLRKQKGSTELTIVMEKLSATIVSRKSNDPTYVMPATIAKRDRLRTSAFKGNEECSSDEDIQSYSKPDTRGPSVSRGSSHDPDSQPAKDRRGRKAVARNDSATKKVFVQEPLENAIEARVPYSQIVEAIRKAPAKGLGRGRTSLKAKHEYEIEMEKTLKVIKELKFFRCGSCQFEVSKHLWVEHFLSHGGLAWIDGFEPPIDIQDWNECLRRTLNNYKTYQQTVFTCQHCSNEMRSAMGHLSHVFVCCESKETIEKRKIQCESCDEKYFPFTASFHRNKCSGRVKVYAADDGDDEEEEKVSSHSDENVTAESFNLCGRTKRKAVKKAEKIFKKMRESKKPLDNLSIVGGQLKCRVCGETDFDSQAAAVEHIRARHELSESEDEASSGSEGVVGGESDSTEETEGSTGDESSQADSPMEEDPNDSDEPTETFSSRSHKAKHSSTESQEMKNGRAITAEYIETLRGKNISKMAIQWTKNFSVENWKTEMFPEIIPKYNLTLSQDAKDFLSKIRFNMKSVKFGSQLIEHYAENYESPYHKGWKQLEIGESDDNQDSSTIFCGGSVSSIDWAPVSGDLNFLAVACNSTSQGININLTETAKSCVQVYEFKHLVNEKFQGFEHTSKLCYVIIINDGPIWSIKFHPSESSIDKRIGLLAVATANQNVLVYSLPYLNNAKSIVLPLKPSLVCQLDVEDNFFNDEFLLQATRVAWFQKSGCDSVLAAGYVNGLVGVWNISRHEYSNEEANNTLYPHHVIQAHLEPITALDFRTKAGSEFQLLTASLDRRLKVYTFDEVHYCEIANYYSPSRVLCAEWWMHWPGYLMGIDDCFTYSSFNYRQPLEFGIRNYSLLAMSSSITDISVNNWLNMAMFVTDAGDVIGCQPDQLMQFNVKEKWKWSYFKHQMLSSTDFNKISDSEINIVFGDFKSQQGKSVPPKKFRPPPTDRINELQINHVCFNRNEESYRFYALGYETGFVRIRYLKNSK